MCIDYLIRSFPCMISITFWGIYISRIYLPLETFCCRKYRMEVNLPKFELRVSSVWRHTWVVWSSHSMVHFKSRWGHVPVTACLITVISSHEGEYKVLRKSFNSKRWCRWMRNWKKPVCEGRGGVWGSPQRLSKCLGLQSRFVLKKRKALNTMIRSSRFRVSWSQGKNEDVLEGTIVKVQSIRTVGSNLVGLLGQGRFGWRHCQGWRELDGCCEGALGRRNYQKQ